MYRYTTCKEMEAVVMRVDAYNTVSQIYQTNGVSAAKKAEKSQHVNDKIEFSQVAKTFKAAKAAVEAAPDVRYDKVAGVKAQIEAGSYNVSSEAVADKILKSTIALTF